MILNFFKELDSIQQKKQVSFDKIMRYVFEGVSENNIRNESGLTDDEKEVLIRLKKILDGKLKVGVPTELIFHFLSSGMSLEEIVHNQNITDEQKLKLAEVWKLIYLNEPNALIKEEQQPNSGPKM